MDHDLPASDSGITVRRNSEGRLVIDTPPEGYHTGFALGLISRAFIMICGALVVGLMFERGPLPAAVGAVFFLFGAWGVYRAWISSRSPRRITDVGDSIETGYLVGGGVAFRKVFFKADIKKIAIQAIWKRRGGFLGLVLGSSMGKTKAQPHSSHLHGIFIRSSTQVEVLGFGLNDAARHWLVDALGQLEKDSGQR